MLFLNKAPNYSTWVYFWWMWDGAAQRGTMGFRVVHHIRKFIIKNLNGSFNNNYRTKIDETTYMLELYNFQKYANIANLGSERQIKGELVIDLVAHLGGWFKSKLVIKLRLA